MIRYKPKKKIGKKLIYRDFQHEKYELSKRSQRHAEIRTERNISTRDVSRALGGLVG